MYQTILTELVEGILTITINRPDKLNALNQQVMSDLDEVMNEVYNKEEIRSVIITGAGPKAFVAGADISEFLSMGTTDGEALARKGQELVFNKIERSPKPIIAAVNGFALGGGCELAMSCHFRLASENAKFGQPEVNLGLIPGYGGTQRLVQLLGKGKGLELMMTAAMIDANEAKQLGLVNYVVAGDELLPKVKELLTTIMSKGPNAVGKVIAAVNAFYDSSLNGFDEEIKLFGECFGTDEMKEGVSAFLEKRKAVFSQL